ELRGFAALSDRASPAVLWGITTAIARQIRLSGTAIEAVGELGRGRYGVLHHGEIRGAALEHAIASLVQAAVPSAPALTLGAATLQPDRAGLHGRSAGRVLRYALERFANGGETSVAVPAPAAELDELFSDTMARVASLERVIEDGIF